MSREDQPNESEPIEEEPSGHPPMQIECREGKMWLMPENIEVEPHVPVGPEEHQRRLFVEYERTFGRGIAKDVTHRIKSGPEIEIKYGSGVVTEYREIAAEFNRVVRNGTPEEVEALIAKIKNFRRNHPALYEDAADRSDKISKPRVRVIDE